MSVIEAVAAETAATNAAVAAAATAAAAEAAATSKAAAAQEAAAKAAAAANERCALDVRTSSNKPDLPKKNGGGAGPMDGEDISGGRCLEWWPGSASSRRRRLGCCRTRHGLRRGHRDGLRPLHVRAHGLRIGLPVAREECHGAEVHVLR